VLLEGEPLVKMVAWYVGLPAGSRERWDGFIASLDGTGRLQDQVEAARSAGRQTVPDPLDRGYSLLLGVLPAAPD